MCYLRAVSTSESDITDCKSMNNDFQYIYTKAAPYGEIDFLGFSSHRATQFDQQSKHFADNGDLCISTKVEVKEISVETERHTNHPHDTLTHSSRKPTAKKSTFSGKRVTFKGDNCIMSDGSNVSKVKNDTLR